ncbi:MAG: S49 family peptidase [Devosia sp.]
MAERSGGIMGWIKRRLGKDGPVIPVVRLHGVIAAEARPGRLNINGVAPLLDRAFGMKGAPAVVIVVNSPGGSPVQSRLIAKRIRDLAREKAKRVIVLVEDAAASGGYFIAVAGDEIIADPSSIVGSIGVIFAGFGFVEAIDKLGITRRVHTAGTNKSTLDPFLPEKPEDVARIKQVESEIHQVFIDFVKERRGGKLTAPDAELFTGEWWTGVSGLRLGLVDALGDLHSEVRRRFGEEARIKIIEPRRPLFGLPRVGIGATLAQDIGTTLEDKALWARFGL